MHSLHARTSRRIITGVNFSYYEFICQFKTGLFAARLLLEMSRLFPCNFSNILNILHRVNVTRTIQLTSVRFVRVVIRAKIKFEREKKKGEIKLF